MAVVLLPPCAQSAGGGGGEGGGLAEAARALQDALFARLVECPVKVSFSLYMRRRIHVSCQGIFLSIYEEEDTCVLSRYLSLYPSSPFSNHTVHLNP